MTGWSKRIATPEATVTLDMRQIQKITAELNLIPDDVRFATNKALRRTASALRVMTSKRLMPELQLRRAMELRRRLKQMRVRAGQSKSVEQVIGLWIGLNDMPISSFKGKAKQVGDGVSFRRGVYKGRFLATMPHQAKAGMWLRTGRSRLPIEHQGIDIKSQADPIIRDEIFPEVTAIFMRALIHDLKWRGRVRAEKAAKGG